MIILQPTIYIYWSSVGVQLVASSYLYQHNPLLIDPSKTYKPFHAEPPHPIRVCISSPTLSNNPTTEIFTSDLTLTPEQLLTVNQWVADSRLITTWLEAVRVYQSVLTLVDLDTDSDTCIVIQDPRPYKGELRYTLEFKVQEVLDMPRSYYTTTKPDRVCTLSSMRVDVIADVDGATLKLYITNSQEPICTYNLSYPLTIQHIKHSLRLIMSQYQAAVQ